MTETVSFRLVAPARAHLASYREALERGWSPDNIRGDLARLDELQRIAEDPDAFLASFTDLDGAGAPITMLDGTTVPRLPGYRRWMWDGEFCGSIGFRWQVGTEALPPYCLGHIGYAVVPWKQRRGYATAALRGVLRDARTRGLRYVELTTVPDNIVSQKVIQSNGGVFVEEFVPPPSLGGKTELRFRIQLERPKA